MLINFQNLLVKKFFGYILMYFFSISILKHLKDILKNQKNALQTIKQTLVLQKKTLKGLV